MNQQNNVPFLNAKQARKKVKKPKDPMSKYLPTDNPFWQDLGNKTQKTAQETTQKKVESVINVPDDDELEDDTGHNTPMQGTSATPVANPIQSPVFIIQGKSAKYNKYKKNANVRPNLAVVGGKGAIKFANTQKNSNAGITQQGQPITVPHASSNLQNTPNKTVPTAQSTAPKQLPVVQKAIGQQTGQQTGQQAGQQTGKQTGQHTNQQQRMTASSFMIQNHTYAHYPKGIPRSFLQVDNGPNSVPTPYSNWQPPQQLMHNVRWQQPVPFGQQSVAFGQQSVLFGQQTATMSQPVPTIGQTTRFGHPTAQTAKLIGQQAVLSQPTALGQSTPAQITSKLGQVTASTAQTAAIGQKSVGQAADKPVTAFQQVSMNPLSVNTEATKESDPQAYSPSDAYADPNDKEDDEDGSRQGSESPDNLKPGEKRLSAFKRLGPVSQPKKPKLTINLLCNKDVREVVDETDDDVPVHLKPVVNLSTEPLVMKFLPFWPWKKPIVVRRTVTAKQKTTKTIRLQEQDLMDEAYERDNVFIQIVVTGYPPSWKKEDVLDTILDCVKGKSFIPCFIEFTKQECKFLVIRSRQALLYMHRIGFTITKDSVQLILSVSNLILSLNQVDFIPRLEIRKLLTLKLGEKELDLKEFTLRKDISHFLYFPLNRITNQTELLQMQTTVQWELLTKLDISHNRLTSLSGFDFPNLTPKLQHFNLGHNSLDKVTILFPLRAMPLKTIVLEGNPLCRDYIQQDHYIKVLKLMFPELVEIDGVSLKPNPIAIIKSNYCTEEAQPIIEKFMEVFFPLLESPSDERMAIENLYDENAVLTITFMYKLRYSPVYASRHALFSRARALDEAELWSVRGAGAVARLVARWPALLHDPTTFNVDLIYHTEKTTIFKIIGVMKIPSETLAEDEHMLLFARTIVLSTDDGIQHRIVNEMIYWDRPTPEIAKTAFQSTVVEPKVLSFKVDDPSDELKEKLIQVFMKITHLPRKPSQNCLEEKHWHLKNALQYFTNLLRIDHLKPIMT